MRTRRLLLPTLAAALLLGPTACAKDPEVLESGGTYVLVGVYDGNNMAGVGFGGTVSQVGDCLGIDGVVVVWPPGTTITSNDPLVIDVPGLGATRVGDRVVGGADEGPLPDGLVVPDGCPTDEVVSFFPDR